MTIEKNGFQILSYRKVLYEEALDGMEEDALTYMMAKLSETIERNYAHFLIRI